MGVGATGLGKNVVAAVLIDHQPVDGRVLILSPQNIIMRQNQRHASRHGGAAFEHGAFFGSGDHWWHSRTTCSTYQTIYSRVIRNATRQSPKARAARKRLDPKRFSLLIADEADLTRATTFKAVIDFYRDENPNLKIVGFTATPDRHDGKSMAPVFDSVAFTYDAYQAIDDGWLVGITGQKSTKIDVDLSDLRGLDFSDRILDQRISNPESLLRISETCLEKVGKLKTIVFVPGVATANGVAALLNNARPGCACCISNKTPHHVRAAYEQGFRRSDFQFLVNVGIVGRGADFPDVQCVFMARPTTSRVQYAQALGRGLRPWPTREASIVDGLATTNERRLAIFDSPKPSLVVFDVTGNYGRHSIVSVVDFMGADREEDVRTRAKQLMQSGKIPARQALEDAERQIAEERAAQEACRYQRTAKVTHTWVALERWGLHNVVEYRGSAAIRGPTDRMIAFLERSGIGQAETLTFRSANECITRIKAAEAEMPATNGQWHYLRKAGFSDFNMLKMPEARQILGMMKSGTPRIVAWNAVMKKRQPQEREMEKVPF